MTAVVAAAVTVHSPADRGRERGGKDGRMATVQCSKCTAERKGFRRELDSWRHTLIHCVGFESILEGIYGSMLLRDLNLFDDCEPEEVDDWSPEATCSHCSFCNLPLDKLSDQVPAATSPLSSPSDYSPCQAPTISESSQTAHRFLQAVFHKKDVPLGCDSNIPLIAQELMKKMIHQFAMEYASKCLLHTSTNGVTTRTSSPLSSDAPLDLTVSRTQEEKEREPEPDGVLDLSNRPSACSATSASSSSSNHKASGCLLPSYIEEMGDLGQREKCHQNSALDAVLSSLCPAHRSLLYQILKLAHQEKLPPFLNCRPVGQTESHCCHCGVNPQDNVTPLPVPFSECKAHNSSSYYPLTDCDHQGHGNTMYDPGDSKSNCSIHRYPLKDCKSEAPLGSSYCCMQRCRMETYTVLCPKRLHRISCQGLAIDHINNMVCSFASPPSLSKSPSLCTASANLGPSSSICCNHHNPHPCPCYSNHACLTQVRNTIERKVGDGDPPCPVLKREQSPSPPPLSPIPSDISKKTDEKPPSLLHHRQEEEADLMVKNGLISESHQEADVDTATEEELECKTPRTSQAEQNASGTSLQDVVNRFSEKLETIRPLEKDPPLASTATYVSEKEQPQSPSTSQNLQFHADAHLTEIITTVLHTGSASDYNLSELFNRHDSKEPKSPNTRSRRRQEVLAAMATPTDDASTRRHTLQIKRELAMLDQSYSRRKVPLAKRARLKDGNNATVTTSSTSSDSNLVKEESKREMELGVENKRVGEGPLNLLSTDNDRDEVKEEIQTVIVTEEVQIIKAEEKEREISSEEKDPTLSGTQIPTPELQSKYCNQSSKGDGVQSQRMTVSTTSVTKCSRPCKKDVKGSSAESHRNHEDAQSGQSSDRDNRPGKDRHSPVRERQKCQSNHSKKARKSGRNIVPPQRFSSYVTEPRKMFFVACFSESIFNQRTQQDKVLTSSTLPALSKNSDTKDTQLESISEAPLSSPEHTGELSFESTQREQCGASHTESKDQSQVFPQTAAAKEKRKKHCSDNRIEGSDCAAKPFGRLRSSPKRPQVSKTASRKPKNPSNLGVTIQSATSVESPLNSLVQYTSPIKLMFVSPVKDKEGVKYSLKSAGSGSSAQGEESFDPCEESSWSGTPEKKKSQSTASPRSKSISSPLKSATSPARSACSPTKSASSSAKTGSSSAKSASSPAKSASSPAKSASSSGKSASSSGKSASSAKSASSSANSASSSAKSASSPSKSASSPGKSASSPSKSGISPAKSASSPKSVSSSPKIGSRRSGDSTPTKRVAGTESQRSSGDLLSFHETTPPKRRPGRPKKLGPQLEQKVKRPIGRPRKEKALDAEMGAKTVNGKSDLASDTEENVNKNLKITVVYGRSRRNKRMVSESFDQLQTEFNDAWQAVGFKSELGILMHNSKINQGNNKTVSTESSEELNFVSPVKESAPHSSSNLKCQKRDDGIPSRKPGRPAKVKISGISVTVTTVSPKQRKIQINKEIRRSPETLMNKKTPKFRSAKEPWTISRQSTSKRSQTVEGIETKDESEDKQQNQPVAVRHSMRVRKPSIYFLHAVATSTSRSYSHSNALLRRSKQLLLNKASNERKQGEQQGSVETSGEKRQLCGRERKNISQDLSRVAGVSVDSIYTPETLRWWAASAEEKNMNQELARRIRLISDTWVPDTVENQEEIGLNSKSGTDGNSSFTGKSKRSSVVRSLFDCSPNKPRSCSMQQLCSWFMQTTETQSLGIVKKASSRNPYELMHFPRTANIKSVCHSPQAERLRKHIKKFAKTVPKSPFQHEQAQKRLRKRNKAPLSTHNIRRQLFTARFAADRRNQGAQRWKGKAFRKYQAMLFRARTRFLTRKERERWRKRQRNTKNIKLTTRSSHGHIVTGLKPKRKVLRRSAKDQLSNCLENSSATSSVNQTQEPVDVPKEQNLCSKAWSPETLKECRVFLRKINSPDNESAEEEWDSCTVTLDDGSPSAYMFAGRERELVGVVKTVKENRKRSMTRRTASRELEASAPKSVQEQDETPVVRQKGKYKSPGVVSTEPPQPQPAKILRQSRMRGLTGPRWCDFVFEH
ncbi:serine/arginine repetitive matrix protein 2 isoform X1 [Thunnus thynnus]|uniref:serine/arginine repetitive matrix protein 2 isoform X1 n=1 Tax=Thunnus thynnus TaxID=8237 RepID=UPI0035275420